MKVIEGKRVIYESDKEFYKHQIRGSKPHDKNRIVKTRIAEALRFLMVGGKLGHRGRSTERIDPGFPSDIKFLDVGCRDGWSLEFLKKGIARYNNFFEPRKKFVNCTGIELSSKTVDYARERGRNVIQGDIRTLRLEENSFDVIFTRHCLEHLDKPLVALKNITFMLKPGGTLLAIVPKETIDIDTKTSLHSYIFSGNNDLADLVSKTNLRVTSYFKRDSFLSRKRKYWYRLSPSERYVCEELWVFGTK